MKELKIFKPIPIKLGIVLLATISVNASGSSQVGYGDIKCAVYNTMPIGKGSMVSNVEAWALGFLSGLNQAAIASGKTDQLKNKQPDRIAGYIRTHCASKSTETIEQAADSYWTKILGKSP